MLTLHEMLSSGPWLMTPRTPDSTMYVFAWPGDTADTLLLSHGPAEDTHLYHGGPTEVPAWSRRGSEAECLAEYTKLPGPTTPGAPIVPLDGAATRDADRST